MSARARIHAMFNLDETAETELDARLDDHRAEVLAADGQAYDGELAMLRSLIRTLRVVARQNDIAEVQRLLIEHASDERDARAEAGEKATAVAAMAASDLHAVIHGAIRSFQVDRHQPGGYAEQLTNHLTNAVAPLVPTTNDTTTGDNT